MKILHIFDEEEDKLLFWVDGIEGGPVIYADNVVEGEAKIKALFEYGEFAKGVLKVKELGKKINEYCKQYEGTDKYNDVVLAIQFGYHLKEKEENGK